MAGAGVAGLNDVCGDDVETAIGQRQKIAAIVDAHGDVGLRQQVVVDVREKLRGLPDTFGEFDDLHARVGILADTAPGVAPPPMPTTSTSFGLPCSTIGRWPIARCSRTISG